jgi:hypothetical protein
MPRAYCRNCKGGFFQDQDEDICCYCGDDQKICALCSKEFFLPDKKYSKIDFVCGVCKEFYKIKVYNAWSILRFKTFIKDNFSCRYCGRSPMEHKIVLHCDHILPRSKGGEDTLDNLITACEDCNMGKLDVVLERKHEDKIKNRRLYERYRATEGTWNKQMENIQNVERFLADDSHVGEGGIQAKREKPEST